MFQSAATELEDAAKQHNDVANHAGAIASEHKSLQGEHIKQAVEAANAATKLRELVGGGK
jgi:hypothetical protein